MVNEENQAAPGNRPVGPQLKKAREAKGLSVVEVAEAQYLRPAIIQAIENGKYELIDTELFLKGYIRAYARQIGLDGNALIADLDRELEPMREEQAQAKAANPLIDIERRRCKKRRVAKTAFWLVALAVLGFLIFAFIYSPSQLANLPGAGAFTGDTAQQNVLESGLNGAVSSIDDDSTTQSTPDDFLPNETNDGDVSASPANAEGALEPLIGAGTGTFSDGEAPADGLGSSPAQTVGNLAAIVDNDILTLDAEEAPQVADNRGRLEIEFIDDCWVQIRDSYGRSLASGLKRQSDRIDLRSETDIRLVIGAANAIGIMRFEGASVDLGSKGIIGNRAEFVLALN
ncbi:cytoskeleton protein rodZ [Marinobacter psychrophilus]|jgi:cytoskeleton protein RodZ|uniref:Cytoskeleton protein rodZ n=1 Tax=Marinobacter psychrophilus TaxID=330734 RepID=A0A0H4I0B1_9GAMM|nr:RodZ domain-containing protein [Marinobacter psychrophilus]AKO52379.1 cytoskeleton protein rodZ [Marinobacter psychrophilus]